MNKYTDSNLWGKTNTRFNVHTIFETIEKLNVWVHTYLSSHSTTQLKKTECLGPYISQFPLPETIENLNVWIYPRISNVPPPPTE